MSNLITKLKNAIGIGARANRYRVYFSFPNAVQRIAGVTEETLSIICSQCDGFPSETIPTSKIYSQGRSFTLPKQKDNGGDWSCTFYNDEEHKFRNTFLLWEKAIDHVPQNSSTGAPLDIMTDIKVAQLDSDEKETVICTFHDVFVTDVSSVTFNGESASDVETFTVKFTYSYYTYGLNSNADDDSINNYNQATKNPTAREG